jgi:hypothetical protein
MPFRRLLPVGLATRGGVDFPHEADMPPLVAVSSEHTWRVSGAPEFDWGFFDSDQAGRRGEHPIRLPRGRLMGGTSMVNRRSPSSRRPPISTAGPAWAMRAGTINVFSRYFAGSRPIRLPRLRAARRRRADRREPLEP